MTEPLFTPVMDRLSSVTRWSLVHTIRKQSVAEHIRNVCYMAEKMCDVLGIYGYERVVVMSLALHHDDVEVVIGDPPAMIKDLVDEGGAKARYADVLPNLEIDASVYMAKVHGGQYHSAMAVVKAADLLDTVCFLSTEISMGNSTVINHLKYCVDKLTDHLSASGFGFMLSEPIEATIVVFSNWEGDPMDRKQHRYVYTSSDTDIPF